MVSILLLMKAIISHVLLATLCINNHLISELIASSSSSSNFLNVKPSNSYYYNNNNYDMEAATAAASMSASRHNRQQQQQKQQQQQQKQQQQQQQQQSSSSYNYKHTNKIPSLENLFQVVTFWDKSNHSSPCQFYGKQRTRLCHKRVLFDKEAYEKSLSETKKLILNRLNLKQEPTVNLNKNTLSFLEEIENHLQETDDYNDDDGDIDADYNQRHHHATSNKNGGSNDEAIIGDSSTNSMLKTKYDMKNTLNQPKIINSMHDAIDIKPCSSSSGHNDDDDDGDYNDHDDDHEAEDGDEDKANANDNLCIKFRLPIRNFFKMQDGVYALRKLNSVNLWLYVETSSRITTNEDYDEQDSSSSKSTKKQSSSSSSYNPFYSPSSPSEYSSSSGEYFEDRQQKLLRINLVNLDDSFLSLQLKNDKLQDGWNTIDVTNLIKYQLAKELKKHLKNQQQLSASMRSSLDDVFVWVNLMLKSANSELKMDLLSRRAKNFEEESSTSSSGNGEDDNGEEETYLYFGSETPRKPLLSISLYDAPISNNNLASQQHHQHSSSSITDDFFPSHDDTVADNAANGVAKKRSKRKVNSNNNQQQQQHHYNNHHMNFKAKGYNKDEYQQKYCHNNYPDSNKECCLITYFINFNSLKWSSWIISPAGFFANYCAGKCRDPNSFKYASHNAEIKLKYNENLLYKDKSDRGDELETCCHPISMESLVVKYLHNNGSIVSTVIPNMIITGCGCS